MMFCLAQAKPARTSSNPPPPRRKPVSLPARPPPRGDDKATSPDRDRCQLLPTVPPIDVLVAAGAPYGKPRSAVPPVMRRYIYGKQRKRAIIDLVASAPLLKQALDALANQARHGRDVLFVGTHPVARQAVSVAAQRSGSPFVAQRWVGGTLTNWRSMRSAVALAASEDAHALPSHSTASRAAARAARRVGGLVGMTELPGAVFLVDAKRESRALHEASRTGVTTIALCNTDVDPSTVDFPILANADAPLTVSLLCELASRAVLHGKGAEAPEAAWAREHPQAGDLRVDDNAVGAGAHGFDFYGAGGFRPLRTALSSAPRGRRKKRRNAKTRGGVGGGVLGRTQRRLTAAEEIQARIDAAKKL